ncbi:MAG TPA: citrate/2-methylcitrate synthase, partial [Planctomycetota bacterium]|nr:citrate/2-methylcitrate synthase [Planctomycetota bacterium]
MADTALSEVDGERGRLVIGGYDVEALAPRATFEEALALLATGSLPGAAARDELRGALGQARVRAFQAVGRLGDALGASDGMDALRAAVGHLRGDGAEGSGS